MSGWLGLIQQALLFGVLVSAMTAAATAAAYPLIKAGLHKLSAATQASTVLILCMLPALMTIMVLLSALLPSLLQLLGMGSDHCIGHEGSHQHFCLIHRPSVLDSQPIALLTVVALLLLVSIAVRLAIDIFRTQSFRKALTGCAIEQTNGAVRILATTAPLAFSSGIIQPRIYLSTGLLHSLSSDEQRLILAHEQAHLQRHDSLRQLLARGFSLGQFPPVRKALLAHLQLASEQACDAIAARQAQDPGGMAALLLKIERLYRQHFPTHAPLAFSLLGDSASTLPQRVRALLAPPAAAGLPWAPAISILGMMTLLLLGHDLLHDWLEHIFLFIA